jgi:tetratricopeptide (TPR) repeat protein
LLALAALAYLPVSGIVPVYPAIAARALFTAEHFLYLPLLGLAPLAAGAAAAWTSPLVARAVLAGALAGWGVLVVQRNRDWRDEATLFRHTLAYDPPAARVWFNAGNVALGANRLDEAEHLYRAALAREPGDAAAHLNLGITLQRRGDRVGAEESYRRAIAADARLREAYRALAALLAARGETAEAERLLAGAAALSP